MNKYPSENLFNKILEQGKNYIENAVAEKTVENYYLDFKTAGESDYRGKRKLFDSDKKNYAKAISAFGNSEGGVIVWGIRTGSAGTDYATGKESIKGVSNFLGLLEGFTSLMTSPPHPTVTNKAIFENENEDTGYVITHIPKSSQRPFQVINGDDFRYYIRAGSNSSPASDGFIRSLFGKEPQPDTFLTWGVSPAQVGEQGEVHMKVGIILHNGGENTSRNINGYVHIGGRGLVIEINQNTINDFSYNQNTINGVKIGFMAKSHFVLGVEQEVQPLIMHINLKKPITENGIQIYTLVNGDNQISYRAKINISRETLEGIYDSYVRDNNFNIGNAIFKSGDTGS